MSRRCQDLIRSIIQEKEHRLCTKRYRSKEAILSHQARDQTGHYVYPDDGEEIKAHRWFKDIQWDRLHLSTPPFVPNIKSLDDTHYFDEEEPISDFSDSSPDVEPDGEEVDYALRPFHPQVRALAMGFIGRPYDSTRLRKVEKDIDAFNMGDEQTEYLKAFVRHYGRKEKKRPRDRLLRDKDMAATVMELRKKGAFLGYSYRRMRAAKDGLGSSCDGPLVVNSVTKKNVWRRARLSLH